MEPDRVLRSSRLWLYVAGGWLILGAVAHLGYHVWGLVLENDVSGGLRAFAMQAMKQAQSPDPLRPSLWRVFRLFSVSLGLLWLFAGIIDLVAAFGDVPDRVRSMLSLTQTIFWTLAFVPFAFVFDPGVLAQGTAAQIGFSALSLLVSTALWAVAFGGWAGRPLGWASRLPIGAAGLVAVIAPSGSTPWMIALTLG